MWSIVSLLLFVIEVLLFLGFVFGRFRKRKLNEAALFIGIVFFVNFSLHLVPYVYGVLELGENSNVILGVLDCFGSSLKTFVGEPKVEDVAAFSKAFPLFAGAYLLGIVIAFLTTISTLAEAFGNSVRNGFRLSKRLKQDQCDFVFGSTPDALRYAQSCNAVLLLEKGISKEDINGLIEEGYTVLNRQFNKDMLKSRMFNTTTRYNIICTDEEKAVSYIDDFIAYKKEATTAKNVYLYVEIEGDKAETVRREIIEKSGMEAFIDTFCCTERLARTFTEKYPVTKYLPTEYIEDAAVKADAEISVFILGFGKLGKELYRQSILNNQLVTFEDGEYRTLPITYYLCDTAIDKSEWNISGLQESLEELPKGSYFPLPDCPFKAKVLDAHPASRVVLKAIKNQVKKHSGYTFVIIDTEADFCNIEIGAKLKTMLFGEDNYHLFVRSEATYVEDDAAVTYFGKRERVFNHDVIVNDSLSLMAKRLNEVYTAQYADKEERNRPDFTAYIQKKAADDWVKLDYFTLYSNIYSAMNLRVKLNLLGLDYVKDGNGENTALIKERHGRKADCLYSNYFTPSVRNALIAQEHARWNAYHLLGEYLPLSKDGITVKSNDGKKVRFNVKNTAAKQHACLTTYQGLNDLSSYLAEWAGNGCTAADYDYYIYDEMLLTSAEELLIALGYSVTEKQE